MKASNAGTGALLFLISITVMVGYATAQVEGGSTIVEESNKSVDASDPGTEAVEAGAVSEVDISQTAATDKWAGFFGNISGTEELGDGSGNTFYQWTASKLGEAKVITIPSGNSAPTGVNPVTDPNSFLGSEFNSGSDNASGTFNATASVTINSDSATTSYVETFDDSGDRDFRTYLGDNPDQPGTPMWIAQGKNSTVGFTGEVFNYQLMVGVGESPADKTFDFYMELP